jgi:hypothetical protein
MDLALELGQFDSIVGSVIQKVQSIFSWREIKWK